MIINLYSCGPSIKNKTFVPADLHVCINSAALFVERCDFLAFHDKLVYDRLIATGLVNPTLGYLTHIQPFDKKFYINTSLTDVKAFIDEVDLGFMVMNGCEFTSPKTLATLSLFKPAQINLFGFDLTQEPTETNGMWCSEHDRISLLREAIWLRFFVSLLGKQNIKIVSYGGYNLFIGFIFRKIGVKEMLKGYYDTRRDI